MNSVSMSRGMIIFVEVNPVSGRKAAYGIYDYPCDMAWRAKTFPASYVFFCMKSSKHCK